LKLILDLATLVWHFFCGHFFWPQKNGHND
jgi:hypothetical protein